ncbi:MAG: hypothetical protein ABI026_07960 [Gemmatimonadaceae bacterium]
MQLRSLVTVTSMTVAGLAGSIVACSASSDSRKGASPPPSESGQVWEVDSASNRSTAAGSMAAFANGLHVIVVDGDDIYAGMQKLKSAPGPDGSRLVTLADGDTASFKQSGSDIDVRFSTGETVHMHQQSRQPEARS